MYVWRYISLATSVLAIWRLLHKQNNMFSLIIKKLRLESPKCNCLKVFVTVLFQYIVQAYTATLLPSFRYLIESNETFIEVNLYTKRL